MSDSLACEIYETLRHIRATLDEMAREDLTAR
jgi:hypothetical protein